MNISVYRKSHLRLEDLEVDRDSSCRCGRFCELINILTGERFCPVLAGIRINWTLFVLNEDPILTINGQLEIMAARGVKSL